MHRIGTCHRYRRLRRHRRPDRLYRRCGHHHSLQVQIVKKTDRSDNLSHQNQTIHHCHHPNQHYRQFHPHHYLPTQLNQAGRGLMNRKLSLHRHPYRHYFQYHLRLYQSTHWGSTESHQLCPHSHHCRHLRQLHCMSHLDRGRRE